MIDGLPIGEPPEGQYKIREKIDAEQWVYEHRLLMTRVQAENELGIYENMMNSLVNSFRPYWPEGFKERWEAARQKSHADAGNPLNKERLEEKECLLAELIDSMDIGFSKKRKMKISRGLEPLWKLYPPYPPSKD